MKACSIKAKAARARRRNAQAGFTLLEVVLALTILSVGMAIVFQAISVGQKSWKKGRDSVDAATRLRVVLDVMATQLRSAHRYEEPSGAPAQKVRKEWTAGDESSIGFVTALPYGVEKKEGLYYVRYFLSGEDGSEQKTLKMVQLPVYAGHPDDYDDDVERGAMVLLSGLRGAVFEFSGPGEGGPSTARTASSRFDGRWPPAGWPGDVDGLKFVRFTFGYPAGGRVKETRAVFAVYSDLGPAKGSM